jgi:ubiquitin carboxyl-terminal hydrolase 7
MGEGDESLAVYDLQSMVIHVGKYGSGHYYAYVRPDMENDRWYRFNDHQVEEVSFDEVSADAFGGLSWSEDSPPSLGKAKNNILKKIHRWWKREGASYGWGGETSNAYVLQYVRRRDIPMLYHPPGEL